MIWEDSRPPTRVLLLNNIVGAGDVDEDPRSVKVAVTSFTTLVHLMTPCSKSYRWVDYDGAFIAIGCIFKVETLDVVRP